MMRLSIQWGQRFAAAYVLVPSVFFVTYSITSVAAIAEPDMRDVLSQQPLGNVQHIATGQAPDGLSATDWRAMHGHIQQSRYQARPDGRGGYQAFNETHGFNINYTPQGETEIRSRSMDAVSWRLALRLSGVGYQHMQTLDKPTAISTKDNVVSYNWNDDIREWWVNSATDLEQWFAIERRPAGAVDGQPLRLRLALMGDLVAAQHSDGIHFRETSGAADISYTGLRVWDAKGRDLPAKMTLENDALILAVNDVGAVYPVTIDPSVRQDAYLKASNTDNTDFFGFAVAIDGDTAVVGAYGEDSATTEVNGDADDNSAIDAGAAYVFVRNGGGWEPQAYLKASNAEAGDNFGYSVGVSGDTIVVGAHLEDGSATVINGVDDNSATNAGAAYVFVRNGNNWMQDAYLKASNAGGVDEFGYSVAVSGNTIVVGARFESSNATGINGVDNNSALFSGAAYVFAHSGAAWQQQAYLKASNTGGSDYFGSAVAISGDTVVIGAILEDSNAVGVNGNDADNSMNNSGAAYVFERSDAEWSQQAYLKSQSPGSSESFGSAVAVSAGTVVVGVPGEDGAGVGVGNDVVNNSAPNAGAAYVFLRSDSAGWQHTAYLKATNTGSFDEFGTSVAVSGDVIVVGAPFEDGNSVGIDRDSNELATDAGAAYLFYKTDDLITSGPYVKASNTDPQDSFGSAVAISAGTFLVGAYNEESNAIGVNKNENENSAPDSGAAYILSGASSGFTIGGSLDGLLLGNSVTLQNNDGDDLVISANGGFTFPTALLDAESYAVTVKTQPVNPAQVCTLINDSGTIAGADITNIGLTCGGTGFSVGGTVSGLAPGATLTLLNNGGDNLVINANGAFTFPMALNDGDSYAVTVQTHPTSPVQACSVNNGSGDVMGGAVTDVQVNCVTADFTVGGTVSGLGIDSVTLQNNGGDDLVIAADGAFTFPTPLADGGSYAVNVLTQPATPGLICSVGNGNGLLGGSNITNVVVVCTSSTFTVGGTVSGLMAGDTLTLQNNGGDDLLVNADGSFTFPTALNNNGSYAVTIAVQPTTPDHVCSVNNGAGVIIAGNVNDILVTCTTGFFSVGGTVTGLAANSSLVVQINGGSDLLLEMNGPFTFPAALPNNSTYVVSVSSQPLAPRQSCVVNNGSGLLAGANVTNITILCSLDTLTVPAVSNATIGTTVEIPVRLETNGAAISAVGFSLDYDESCLNPDVDGDGNLDSVTLLAPVDFTLMTLFDPLDADGEIDLSIVDIGLPIALLSSGDLVRIGFRVLCQSGIPTSTIDVPIGFSSTPSPSFGDDLGQDVNGTWADGMVRIWPGLRGDCNSSGAVRIADLTAISLEIFDGDGDDWFDAPLSSFIGSPVGCDANASLVISAGDINCANLLAFEGSCGGLAPAGAGSPQMQVTTYFDTDMVWIQSYLTLNDRDVGSVSYSLDLDPAYFDLMQVDIDGDGLPDHLRFPQGQPDIATVNWNVDDADGELDILLSDMWQPPEPPERLPEGLLVEIGIPAVEQVTGGLSLADDLSPSFGSTNGTDIDGAVFVSDAFFSDGFESSHSSAGSSN